MLSNAIFCLFMVCLEFVMYTDGGAILNGFSFLITENAKHPLACLCMLELIKNTIISFTFISFHQFSFNFFFICSYIVFLVGITTAVSRRVGV